MESFWYNLGMGWVCFLTHIFGARTSARVCLRRGITIVELLIAAAGLAMVLGLFSRFFSSSFKTETKARSVQNFSTSIGILLKTLQDTTACDSAFLDASNNLVKNITAGPVSVNRIRAHGAADILSLAQPTISSTTKLISMTLENPQHDDVLTLGGVLCDHYYANLRVTANETIDGKSSTLEKVVPVSLFVDFNTKEIKTCGLISNFTPGNFSGIVSNDIVLTFKKNSPFGPNEFDSNVSIGSVPPFSTLVAGPEYRTCFLVGVALDPEGGVQSGINAQWYRVDHSTAGNFFSIQANRIDANPDKRVEESQFRFRCIK